MQRKFLFLLEKILEKYCELLFTEDKNLLLSRNIYIYFFLVLLASDVSVAFIYVYRQHNIGRKVGLAALSSLDEGERGQMPSLSSHHGNPCTARYGVRVLRAFHVLPTWRRD